jgi:hypothetical protein
MTRPKSGQIVFSGINKDLIPGVVPADFWSDGRNVMFCAGETVRVPGEGKFAETGRLFDADVVHFVDTGTQQWWIYAGATTGGSIGVGVTNGTTHWNVTPAGWAPIASANKILTIGDLNTLPFINHPEIGPFWWDGVPANVMQKLPDWPASQTCRAMRAHKNFLMAICIDNGTTLLEGQVSWSSSAPPQTVPQFWVPSPTNDAGDLNFASPGGPLFDGLDVRDQFLVAKQNYMGVMQYVGGAFIFEKRDVFPTIGLFATNAWVQAGNLVFMLTGEGALIMHDMTSINNLLYGKLQDYVKSQINYQWPSSVFMYADHEFRQIGLAYPVGTSKACTEAVTVELESWRPGIRDLPRVFGWGHGLVEVALQSWDSDHTAWDDDITTWNQNASGFQPERIVFAGGSQGLIQQGKTNDQLAASGAAQAMEAYVTRAGIDMDEYGVRKTVSGAVPRIHGNLGDVILLQFGAQESDNASVDLTAELAYTIGVDDRVDFFLDGRLLSIGVRSVGGAPWRYAGIHPDVRQSGRW